MSYRRAFSRKGVAAGVNSLRIACEQPLLKILFFLLFAICFEFSLLRGFELGFSSLGTIGTMLVPKLFSVFYFGMGSMLVVSSAVTAYGSLFRDKEINFLLSKPVPFSTIFLYRFFQTTKLSSWAFFFIMAPFVGAYMIHMNLGLSFGLWALCYSIPYLFIASAMGTAGTLIAVRFTPPGKVLYVCLLFVAIAVTGLVYYVWGITPRCTIVQGDFLRFRCAGLHGAARGGARAPG